jgi:uncharacterized DUF497 family protein
MDDATAQAGQREFSMTGGFANWRGKCATWRTDGRHSRRHCFFVPLDSIWFCYYKQYTTMKIKFEWDSAKADTNMRKHGVDFDTAIHAFADPFAILEQNRIENGELRWQTLGMAGGFMLLLVAHTISDEEAGIEVIRVISARHADKKEKKRYEQNYRQQNS